MSEELIAMPSTSVAGVWREPQWVTLVTFAALARGSMQVRFGLMSAVTGLATVVDLLTLVSYCCAPPLTWLFVRYGSGFETRVYLVIVVGLLGALLTLVSFALGRIPISLLGSVASA